MAENTVKKIATRESYGNALLELGAENPNVEVLDADLAAATETGVFKKAYADRSTAVLRKAIWWAWQQDLPQLERYLLSAASPCLRQAEPLSR